MVNELGIRPPVVVPFRVSSPYGWRTLKGDKQFHDGIDFVSESNSHDVLAIADGRFVYDQDDYDDKLRWTDKHHSGGNMVIQEIKLNGVVLYCRYLHLIKNFISKGQLIGRGQVIGEYGDVGYSFGAHLHFDLYNHQWKKIDPTFLFEALI